MAVENDGNQRQISASKNASPFVASQTAISPRDLLNAYAVGIFPMADKDGHIEWFAPRLRGILPLDKEPRFSHGVRRDLRRRPWEIRVDVDFRAVIQACADREETWISKGLIESYCALHRLGYAHSIEVWLGETLVGGLYGVHLGAAFFGESMVSRVSGASKAALAALMHGLRNAGFELLDTQWKTDHLAQFGAIEISQRDYLFRLERALSIQRPFPRTFCLPGV